MMNTDFLETSTGVIDFIPSLLKVEVFVFRF